MNLHKIAEQYEDGYDEIVFVITSTLERVKEDIEKHHNTGSEEYINLREIFRETVVSEESAAEALESGEDMFCNACSAAGDVFIEVIRDNLLNFQQQLTLNRK